MSIPTSYHISAPPALNIVCLRPIHTSRPTKSIADLLSTIIAAFCHIHTSCLEEPLIEQLGRRRRAHHESPRPARHPILRPWPQLQSTKPHRRNYVVKSVPSLPMPNIQRRHIENSSSTWDLYGKPAVMSWPSPDKVERGIPTKTTIMATSLISQPRRRTSAKRSNDVFSA